MKERADRWESKYNEAYLKLEKFAIPEWVQKELEKMIETRLTRIEYEIEGRRTRMVNTIRENVRQQSE